MGFSWSKLIWINVQIYAQICWSCFQSKSVIWDFILKQDSHSCSSKITSPIELLLTLINTVLQSICQMLMSSCKGISRHNSVRYCIFDRWWCSNKSLSVKFSRTCRLAIACECAAKKSCRQQLNGECSNINCCDKNCSLWVLWSRERILLTQGPAGDARSGCFFETS